MVSENVIDNLCFSLVKMVDSNSIGFVGYNLTYNILGIVYENSYNMIYLYENVPENEFHNIINQKDQCGIYISEHIQHKYEYTKTSRRRIVRTLI